MDGEVMKDHGSGRSLRTGSLSASGFSDNDQIGVLLNGFQNFVFGYQLERCRGCE